MKQLCQHTPVPRPRWPWSPIPSEGFSGEAGEHWGGWARGSEGAGFGGSTAPLGPSFPFLSLQASPVVSNRPFLQPRKPFSEACGFKITEHSVSQNSTLQGTPLM